MGGIRDVSPYTYEYDTHAVADIISYQLLSVAAFDGNQAWTPVTALAVTNSDTSLHFLAQNTVSYNSPVSDIWFSANRSVDGSGNGVTFQYYKPDLKVSVMACTQKYQICIPGSSPYACTILGSGFDLNLSAPLIGLNTHQMVTAQRIIRLLPWTSTYQSVVDLGSRALLAEDSVTHTLSPGLPDDQWQLEVRGWFETSLAKLQDYIVQFAVNTADLGEYGFIIAPSPDGGPEQQAVLDFCSNQRVRNTGGYRSFSFLGLMIVVCVGTKLLVISWVLEPLTSYVRSKQSNGKYDYREVARVADYKLQLHRMALVGAGYDDIWERTLDSVPVAVSKQYLPPATRILDDNTGDFHYAPRAAAAAVPAAGSEMRMAPAPRLETPQPSQTPELIPGLGSTGTSQTSLTCDHRV